MLVQDVMQRALVIVSPDTKLAEAVRLPQSMGASTLGPG